MRRYGLRNDRWEQIKDVLPRREDHVGGTTADNRLFVEAVLYRYRGVIFFCASATGRMSTGACVAGAKVVLSRGYFVIWRRITTMNT